MHNIDMCTLGIYLLVRFQCLLVSNNQQRVHFIASNIFFQASRRRSKEKRIFT